MLDRVRQQGQTHALLESPTGTGKSLSLLCFALAWQRNYALCSLPAAPAPTTDPFLHGGGFIADDTQPQVTPVIPEKTAKKKNAPAIYATRTHAQITQVVREYRKTPYEVLMTILIGDPPNYDLTFEYDLITFVNGANQLMGDDRKLD